LAFLEATENIATIPFPVLARPPQCAYIFAVHLPYGHFARRLAISQAASAPCLTRSLSGQGKPINGKAHTGREA